VDVERLIDDDHSARSISEAIGGLDLSLYEAKIAAVVGRAGRRFVVGDSEIRGQTGTGTLGKQKPIPDYYVRFVPVGDNGMNSHSIRSNLRFPKVPVPSDN
jgi:hypothetical protein